MSIIFTWKGVLFVFLFQAHELSKRLIVSSVKSNAKIIAKEQTALKLFIHFVFSKDTKDHYSEEGCKHRDIQICCSSQNWACFFISYVNEGSVLMREDGAKAYNATMDMFCLSSLRSFARP